MTELPPTEQRHPRSMQLGDLRADEVVALMAAEEPRVLAAVDAVAGPLAEVAERLAGCLQEGGRAVALGAGTGGRLALQEFAEVSVTFGVPREQLLVFVAGRLAVEDAAVAKDEDDLVAVRAALAQHGIGPGDLVLGLTASGSTPFVASGLSSARAAGAWTCVLAHDPASPLLSAANLGICLNTGPELLTGSTRLKAGTAQKLALNRITTAAMVVAGRVVSNHMIEVDPSNRKLRERAQRMVCDLAGVSASQAGAALEAEDGSVRAALERLRRQGSSAAGR